MTGLEDWDDILQKAGYDAGYKTAIEEILKELEYIRESHEIYPMGENMLKEITELIEKWSKMKCHI